MGIVKMADMQKRFTEVVNQYLARGLEFELEAMRGSQGEEGKVALADPDKNCVYIIYLHGEMDNSLDLDFTDRMVLTVGMYPKHRPGWSYWLGGEDMTVVYEEEWYRISRDMDGRPVYVADARDAQDVINLRRSRRKARGGWTPEFHPMCFKPETIINLVKAKTGRKRVNHENIVQVEKHRDRNYWKVTTMFNGTKKTILIG